jgi:hypothetical protein
MAGGALVSIAGDCDTLPPTRRTLAPSRDAGVSRGDCAAMASLSELFSSSSSSSSGSALGVRPCGPRKTPVLHWCRASRTSAQSAAASKKVARA